jgi:hypothetical protein
MSGVSLTQPECGDRVAVRKCKVVKLIETEALMGNGASDPYRMVRQLWTLDGKLVVTFDPYGGGGAFTL